MPLLEKMVAKYPKSKNASKDSEACYCLEGRHFPATYNYGKDTTVKEMIDQMLAAMDQNLTPYSWNTWEQEHQCKRSIDLLFLGWKRRGDGSRPQRYRKCLL